MSAPLPEPESPQGGESPFDAIWAQLIGPEIRTTQAPPEKQSPLADRVRAHFTRNKPAPSSFPALAIQIMDLVSQPEVEIHELLKTIGPDPAISAHLMRVANSALYHRGQDVLDLRTAVMKIGVRGVGEIAAGVAGRSLFDVAVRVEYETFPDRWQKLFLATMTTAFAASQFSFEQHHGRPDRIFLGGMFVDIGKTLALRSLARLIMAGQVNPELPSAEVDALLEEVHTEIGCEALGIWGLPSHLMDLCRRQHEALLPEGEDCTETHVLRLVDGLGRLMGEGGDPTDLEQTRRSLEALHMDRVRMRMLHHTLLTQGTRVALLYPA